MKPRIAQPELGALDRWIADQPDPKPSRADALRLALRDWLTGMGYLKQPEPREFRAASRRPKSPGDPETRG